MRDFLQRRQNVVEVDAATLNAKMLVLVNLFGEKWLSAKADHPLQRLWNRTDVLATNELLNFSHAVELLQRESPGWLRSKVKTIKAGSAGGSAGALFEIIALGLFSRQKCEVVPAPGVTPGFDGTLKLPDGAQVLLSIKNHGMSAREREFIEEAKSLDAEIQKIAEASSLRDIDLTVLAMEHLDKRDFEKLKDDISLCLAELKAGGTGYALDRPYQIIIKNLGDQYGPLSRFRSSSICRVISPVAKNEQVNFEDAIRKGCNNLYYQTKNVQGNEICRAILFRLSNSASATLCCDWAAWYF